MPEKPICIFVKAATIDIIRTNVRTDTKIKKYIIVCLGCTNDGD